MCGLIGFSGPKDKTFNIDKIKMILWNNQDRGKDSFGYYVSSNNIIHKELGKVEDIMSKKEFTIEPSNTFIGHVRAATIGAVSKENAHPFNYGNITLAMNGTLTNAWELCRQIGVPVTDFDVDSQVVAYLLNRAQSKEPLTKLIGSCALLYTDTNTGKLYCYRNSDRPLFRGKLDDCMYISSVDTSLKIIGCSDVKEFKQDVLYEIENGQVKDNFKVKRAVTPATVNTSKELTTKIKFSEMHKSEFEGLYLCPTRDIKVYGGKTVNFRSGCYYLVVKHSTAEYEIEVKDESGEAKCISKYMFNEEKPVISKGSFVFGLSNLVYTSSNVKDDKLGSKGDLYIVDQVTKKGNLYCINQANNKSGYIDPIFLRYASLLEVREYFELFYLMNPLPIIENTNEETPNLNLPVVLTQGEIYKKEVYSTAFLNFEELVGFTIDEIEDQLSDLEEIIKKPQQLLKINNMKILIENFTKKAEVLLLNTQDAVN